MALRKFAGKALLEKLTGESKQHLGTKITLGLYEKLDLDS